MALESAQSLKEPSVFFMKETRNTSTGINAVVSSVILNARIALIVVDHSLSVLLM